MTSFVDDQIRTHRFVPSAVGPADMFQLHSFDEDADGRTVLLAGYRDADGLWSSHVAVDDGPWVELPFEMFRGSVRRFAADRLIVFEMDSHDGSSESELALLDLEGRVVGRCNVGGSIGEITVVGDRLMVGYTEVTIETNERSRELQRQGAVLFDLDGNVKWRLKAALQRSVLPFEGLYGCDDVTIAPDGQLLFLTYTQSAAYRTYRLDPSSSSLDTFDAPELLWHRALTQSRSGLQAMVVRERAGRPNLGLVTRIYATDEAGAWTPRLDVPSSHSIRAHRPGTLSLVYDDHVLIVRCREARE